jgi:F0F1-type ATP synthase membrane subunit c/vacuolar-type H+-ATPase subunit K
MNGTNGTGAGHHYRITSMIAIALIIGQLAFVAVSWFLHSSGERELSAEPALNLMTYIWIALAFSMLAVAFGFRQRIVTQAERTVNRTVAPADVQNQTIIMLALLESAGLMGIVVYFLYGHPQILYAVLAYILVSALLFFPRREWFNVSPPV